MNQAVRARQHTTNYWFTVCREHIRSNCGLVKLAELGGDGQDIPFEQAFSNLAHAYLRDKAPSLLDHELGFQLLDRNQDNTKAIGVFAFKVGSTMLFAPTFFLQGELKGHELLYLKNQDMFVPLKENWLNYILNRKPNILGSSVTRMTSQLGGLQPDLNRLSQSPYKYASHVIPSLRPFMPKYASMCLPANFAPELQGLETHMHDRLNLGHFLKQASMPMLETFVATLQAYPRIAQAFDQWHGMDTLQQAVKEAGVRLRSRSVLDETVPKYRAPLTTGSILKQADDDAKQKVKVVRLDLTTVSGPPEGLTEDDKEKLLKDSVLIKDDRKPEETSVPYNVQVEQKLFNPGESGLYLVLTKPGEFEKCFITINPVGPNGRKNFATLVRVGDSANWCNAHPSTIWCGSKIEGTEYDDWFKGLKEVGSLKAGRSRYILLGQRGSATLPFCVEKEIGSEDGSTSYEVDFDTYCDDPSPRPGTLTWNRPCCIDSDYDSGYSRWRDGQRIHIDGKDGTAIRSSMGDVYIPKGYKVLTAKAASQEEEKAHEEYSKIKTSPFGESSSSETPPIRPGNLVDQTLYTQIMKTKKAAAPVDPPALVLGTLRDAEMAVMVKTAELKVHTDHSDVIINGRRFCSFNDGLIHLVVDHGLREDPSRYIIKQAQIREAQVKGAFRCRVKYAEPYMTDQGPNGPAIPDPSMGAYNPMGFAGQTISPFEREMQIPELSASNTDPRIYNPNPMYQTDPMDINAVQSAAQSGQKEVFDTAMIGSMLKAVRDDTMIDRYLPDLIKGMDRLGRILFMFYWHGDRFAERYGKMDMPELEDSLRNAFEMLGDVILFLKQKTVEPYPEEDVSALSLDQVSEQ